MSISSPDRDAKVIYPHYREKYPGHVRVLEIYRQDAVPVIVVSR